MPQQEPQPSDDRTAAADSLEAGRAAAGEGGSEAQSVNQPPPESLLRRVLDETVTADTDFLAPAELEAMRDVAKRHQKEAFDVEPVGVALVESVLTLRLPEYQATETKWRDMSQQIAAAFFEAPDAHARLKRLWDRLCASTS